MKKSILLVLWVFSILIAHSQENEFSVDVNIDNIPDSFNLNLVYFSDGVSKEVDKNSDNIFVGSLNETTPLFLFISDSARIVKRIDLFISNENIKIYGSLDDYKITGSKTQDMYEEWRKKTESVTYKRTEVLNKLHKLYDQASSDTTYHKELSRKLEQYNRLTSELTKEFVRNNPYSKTSVLLLDNIKTNFPLDTIRVLYKKITRKYCNNSFGKKIDLFVSINPVEVGDKWIDFSAFNLDGNQVNFQNVESLYDKYILLVFSSQGCSPCEMAIPELKKIYSNYSDKIEIVTYNVRTSVEQMKQKVENKSIYWTYLSNKMSDNKTMYNYGSYGTPKFVLISPKRKIVYSWPIGYKKGLLFSKVSELVNTKEFSYEIKTIQK